MIDGLWILAFLVLFGGMLYWDDQQAKKLEVELKIEEVKARVCIHEIENPGKCWQENADYCACNVKERG